MIRQGKIWLAAGLLAIGASGCFDDPASDLRGGASALNLDRSTIVFTPDSTIAVIAYVKDQQGNTLPVGTITWTTGNAAVATVTPDTVNTTPGGSSARAFITGVGGGGTYVYATAGGFTDSTYVVTLPPQFNGSVTATGTTEVPLTISGTSLFSFDPPNVAIYVDGKQTFVTAATASSVSFIAPPATNGVVTIEGLKFLGNITLGALDAATTINVTESTEPANDGPLGGQAIAGPVAVGDSVIAYVALDDVDIDDFITLTTAGTAGVAADSALYSVEWYWYNDAMDIDGYVLNAAASNFCAYDGGCGAATGSDPEQVDTAKLAGGTQYNILAEMWDSAGEPVPVPVRIIIKKIG